ncbi:MAG: hypothetical protein V4467_03020 [Patescibacteria group bacterium]
MEKISFFLEKFKTLGLGDILTKRLFAEQVEKVLNIKLNKDDVSLRDGVIYVKAHPVLKSELYMKKQLVIDELSKVLGSVKITGLR